MYPHLANLVRRDRPLDRGPYFVIGVVLLIVKFGLDSLMARLVFGRSWTLLDYLEWPATALWLADSADQAFHLALALQALPFVAVGLALTRRRLQSVGLPAWLLVGCFVPGVNLFLFLTLSLLRSRKAPSEDSARRPEPVGDRIRPAAEPITTVPEGDESLDFLERDRLIAAIHRRVAGDRFGGDALFALLLTVPLAVLCVVCSVHALVHYGWGLFVGMPFILGMGSVLLYGLVRPKTLWQCITIASLAMVLVFVALLALAIEGAVCLLMAAPLAFPLAIMDAVLAYLILQMPRNRSDLPALWLALACSLPALMAAEWFDQREPELIEVTTAIDIDAPPWQVWESVVAFPPLPEPDEWLFRAGVAYPVGAELDGRGVGGIRRCNFSTGTFVEPVTVWDPPHRLAFDVVEQPVPMVEWSPYEIHPPHLDHYLVSQRGEFRLIALPGGRTRLQGTTWYTNKMWPAVYWQRWSDHIIQRIHLRVLRHIQTTAETP